MDQAVKCIKTFPPFAGIRYDELLWQKQHGDSLVILNCHSSGIYYPEHWTPFSLKFAFAGREYYKLRNITYAVGDNYFLVLNRGNQYESFILPGQPTESLTINYPQRSINDLYSYISSGSEQLLDEPFPYKGAEIHFIEKLYPYQGQLLHHVERLKSLVAADRPDSFALTETLYLFLTHAIRLNQLSEGEMNHIDAKKQSTRRELYTRLVIAKDYLHSSYDRNISLAELSGTCFMNPYYMLRQFRKLFGLTPHQYLVKIRLQHAAKQLLDSEKKINEIMHEAGYENAASFGKLFKKTFGNSPTAYRKK